MSGISWSKPPLPVPGFDVALVWHPRRDGDAALGFVRDEIARLASDAAADAGAGAARRRPRRRQNR
jgi:hypothetical protein